MATLIIPGGVTGGICCRYNGGQFAFFSPPLGERSLGATYAVHLRFIGKLIVDFLLVIIELFSLDLRAEPLRANID